MIVPRHAPGSRDALIARGHLEAAARFELADVRAKQEFAVSEVKHLMAKLAVHEDGRGAKAGKVPEGISVIDENLERMRRRAAAGSSSSSSGGSGGRRRRPTKGRR